MLTAIIRSSPTDILYFFAKCLENTLMQCCKIYLFLFADCLILDSDQSLIAGYVMLLLNFCDDTLQSPTSYEYTY